MLVGLLRKIDPPVDYVGQNYSANLMVLIFSTGYTLAFILGAVLSDLKYTLWVGVATAALCLALTVPAWPYFRRHPLKFKKPKSE